jgi:hypothetical protein
LLDAGVVVCFEGRIGLDDGVGYVDYSNFHCLDLFLEGVVDAVGWDGSGEGGGGEESKEGGEVGELHGCGLMMRVVEFRSVGMVIGVLEVCGLSMVIVFAVDVGVDER